MILGDWDSAPALKSQVGEAGRTADNYLHAEDGVIYWFENSQNHHISPDEAKNWKFPEGTRLAVHGKVKVAGNPRDVGPCTTTRKNSGTIFGFEKVPACVKVVSNPVIPSITYW